MSILNKIPLLLATLLVLALIFIPHSAFALVTPPGDDCAPDATGMSPMDQYISDKQMAAIQDRIARQGNILALLPAITSDSILCLDKIKALLDQIDTLSTSSDFTGIGALAGTYINNAILNALSATCSTALSDVTGFENMITSAVANTICIPMPDISFGKLSAHTFPTTPPCANNSVPLLTLVPNPGAAPNPLNLYTPVFPRH